MQNSADASTTLARSTYEANAALAQLQSDFVMARKTFQDELLHDLEASTTRAQTFLAMLVNSMDTAVQSAMSRVTSATKEVESETAHLREVSTCIPMTIPANFFQHIQGASADVIKLGSNVGDVFERVSTGGAKLAAAHSEQWSQSHEIAAQVHGSLQKMRSVEVNALLSMFQSMHNQLVSSRLLA